MSASRKLNLPPDTGHLFAGGLCEGQGEFREAHRAGFAAAGRATMLLSLPAGNGPAQPGGSRGRGELRGIICQTSSRNMSSTRPDKEDEPRAPHRNAEFTDRPGVPDVSRAGRAGMNCFAKNSRQTAAGH